MNSTFYTLTESLDTVSLPDSNYWCDRLTCKGCNFPLTPPIFYCYNSTQVHPLCRNCSHCNVPNCLSKVSPNRSVVLEKLLGLACFACQYSCKKSLLEASEYKLHIKECHFRPLNCQMCRNMIDFRDYLQHLREGHDMRRVLLDRETLILDFATGQPRLQYVRFHNQVFLIRYENLKLWVELLSKKREMSETFFKIRVSGVKYKIEFEMEVHNPRTSNQAIVGQYNDQYVDDENNNNYYKMPLLKKFAMPPPDEELFLLFISDCPSGDSHITTHSNFNSVQEFRSRNDNSIYV